MELHVTDQTAAASKSGFRSLEANVNLRQQPLKVVITGSLFINESLENITVVKLEEATHNPGELILQLSYTGKTASPKGVYNIFHYSEKIPHRAAYQMVRIICQGMESDWFQVRELR